MIKDATALLDYIREAVNTISAGVTGLSADTADIATIKTDIAGILADTADIAAMKADLATMKADGRKILERVTKWQTTY